jgi:ankyrin repeat protein
MSGTWRKLERKTLFVSCSMDMDAEAVVVRNVLDELNQRLPPGDRWDFYRWTEIDESWPATGTFQQFIPRTSDPNCGAVICLFGERLGNPLPAYFSCPPELAARLPQWGVRFPWVEGGDATAVPLTGTLFELLDAIPPDTDPSAGRDAGLAADEPRQLGKVICYFKADRGRFSTPGLAPEQRRYGFEHLYDRLRKGEKRLHDRRVQRAYDDQIDYLDRFSDVFFRKQARPSAFFGSDDTEPDNCLTELHDRLVKDLAPILGVSGPASERRELPGLASYEPEDYRMLRGRDRQIERILDGLRTLARAARAGGKSPAMVLHGRRGEGKSSLLRAGLIGRLRHGRYPNFGRFQALVIDPVVLGTDDPLRSLIEAIGAATECRPWRGVHKLSDFSPTERANKAIAGIGDALDELPPDKLGHRPRLFIGFDQIEELLVAAEEDLRIRAGVLELFAVIRKLAEADRAWVVLAVPNDHLDQLTRFLPDWAMPTESLGPPDTQDLRDIVQHALDTAGVEARSGEVDDVVKQATDWLRRQEDPGPVLPLLAALMVEMVRERRNAWKQLVSSERAYKQLVGIEKAEGATRKATLDGVLDMLGERAWAEAEMSLAVDPDGTLARLLRQLVETGLKEGGNLKLLRHCPHDHAAIARARPLVDALLKHRLLLRPQRDTIRLVHIAIVDYWKRAADWYAKDARNQKTLAMVAARAQEGQPITEVADLDAVAELWEGWYDDRDRLAPYIGLMRKSLMIYFDPGARSEQWRRTEGGRHFVVALGTGDPLLAEHCLKRVAALQEPARSELVRFVSREYANAAIHSAAWRGNIDAVRRLIALGADVDRPNRLGQTPLWLAASGGHPNIAALLVEEGADVNHVDTDGNSVLLHAVWSERESSVAFLADRPDIRIDRANADEWTPLLFASLKGQGQFARLLLDRGADPNHNDQHARGPLLLAASAGHVGVARLLIARGAIVDAKDSEGSTALSHAAGRGSVALIRQLLDSGADVNHASSDGTTAIMIAALRSHQAAADLLLERRADIQTRAANGATPLIYAAAGGLVRLAGRLLDTGADPKAAMDDGRTALHLAAEAGHEAVVSLLLGRGADIDAADKSGQTALMTAVVPGHAPVVKVLLERGADLRKATWANNYTALMLAANFGHDAVAQLLLAHKADVNAATPAGDTALINAAGRSHETIAIALIRHGADVNAARGDGVNALQLAAQQGAEDIVKALVDGGADLQHQSKDGRTALIVAAEYGHHTLARLLLDHGAPVDMAMNDGRTALLIAAQKGRDACFRPLIEHGAKWDRVSADGDTALTYAAYAGSEPIMRILLGRGVDPNSTDRQGISALAWAVYRGKPEAVALLLERGARIGEANEYLTSAALSAASHGYDSVLKLLLDKGLSANAIGTEGVFLQTSLSELQELIAGVLRKKNIAVELPTATSSKGNDAMGRELIAKGIDLKNADPDDATMLTKAAGGGHAATAKLLLERGADIGHIDGSGRTAFQYAVTSDKADLVTVLLDHGASIAATDREGLTPLAQTALAGKASAAKVLLDRGADVAHIDAEGFTALHHSVQSNDEKIIRVLLEGGAKVDSLDRGGRTPLVIAATLGKAAAAKVLLEYGADFQSTTSDVGANALLCAVASDSTEIIQLLLDRGADIGIAAGAKTTPLFIAAHMGNLASVKFLLEHGAQVDLAADGKLTPLFAAASEGHDAVVQMLLESDADPDLPIAGLSPLMIAARFGHADVVQLLLGRAVIVDRAIPNTGGMTSLMSASSYGHDAVVRLLLDRGAKIDHAAEDGATALMKASFCGFAATAGLLVDRGAGVDLVDAKGMTALMHGAAQGHQEVVRLLLDRDAAVNHDAGDGSTALMRAAGNGHDEVVRLLLGRGAQIETTDKRGYSALMYAAEYGHQNVLTVLLDRRANLAHRAENGWDALTAAVANDREAASIFLIERGAEVDGRGAWTPLIAASHYGRERTSSILLNHGASISKPGTDGTTPLVTAAGQGHVGMVALLLDRGANVHDADDDGTPAIMAAAGEARDEAVRALLNRGADVNQSTLEGGTALMLTAQNGHMSTVRLLLEHGADPLAVMRDGSGRTALTFARDNSREEISRLLLDCAGGEQAFDRLTPPFEDHDRQATAVHEIPESDRGEQHRETSAKRRVHLARIAVAIIVGSIVAIWWAWLPAVK